MARTSRQPRARRVQAAAPAPGVAKVRLSGDPAATDALTMMLRADPSVEILTGPDRYDDGRQYLTVRMDGGLGRDRDVPEDTLLRVLHPDRDEAATAAPRLLPAPCGEYITRVPYGPCTTCGRTRYAHEIAAAAAGAPWTDDNNDEGGTP